MAGNNLFRNNIFLFTVYCLFINFLFFLQYQDRGLYRNPMISHSIIERFYSSAFIQIIQSTKLKQIYIYVCFFLGLTGSSRGGSDVMKAELGMTGNSDK